MQDLNKRHILPGIYYRKNAKNYYAVIIRDDSYTIVEANKRSGLPNFSMSSQVCPTSNFVLDTLLYTEAINEPITAHEFLQYLLNSGFTEIFNETITNILHESLAQTEPVDSLKDFVQEGELVE